MTTLVLLDTNIYLRLAKRIKPLLGHEFGQKQYVPTILKVVEDEVHRSSKLKFRYPWFDSEDLADERLAKGIRLSKDERATVDAVTSVLHQHVLEHAVTYTTGMRSPPSQTDCFILAFGQIRQAIVVTDDLGMHKLASEFQIPVWHGHELLKKMLTARIIGGALIREIYLALENNNDLPDEWKKARHTSFIKIFGKAR